MTEEYSMFFDYYTSTIIVSYAVLNESGRIFLEIGMSTGARRCTELHIPADNYVNARVQEFELELLPFEFYPQLCFGTNIPAWLFVVEPSGKPNNMY